MCTGVLPCAHEYRCLKRPEALDPHGIRVTDGCKPPDMEHNSGPLGVEYLLLHSEPFLQPPYWLFLKQTWEDSRHSQHTYSLTTLTSISTWTARRAATRILFQSTHTLSTCSEQLSKAPPSTPMVNRVT